MRKEIYSVTNMDRYIIFYLYYFIIISYYLISYKKKFCCKLSVNSNCEYNYNFFFSKFYIMPSVTVRKIRLSDKNKINSHKEKTDRRGLPAEVGTSLYYIII